MQNNLHQSAKNKVVKKRTKIRPRKKFTYFCETEKSILIFYE